MEIRWQIVWAVTALLLTFASQPLVDGKAVKQLERRSLVAQHDAGNEDVGEGRLLASLFFPIFPQYHGVNYGDTMELMTKADTVGYFVVRHTITVRPFQVCETGSRCLKNG